MFWSFCRKISKCDNLTSLNLNFANNKITDDHFRRVGYNILKCSKLTRLHLNFANNNLCGEFFTRLRNDQLTSLSLNFEGNQHLDDKEGATGLVKLLGRQLMLRECTVALTGTNVSESLKCAILRACEADSCCPQAMVRLKEDFLGLQEDGHDAEELSDDKSSVESLQNESNSDSDLSGNSRDSAATSC